MQAKETQGYSFCPKCGAVMQNGLCPGCGYGKKGRKPKETSGGKREPEEKKIKKALKISILNFIVLCALVLISYLVGKDSGLEKKAEEPEEEVTRSADTGTDYYFDGSLKTMDPSRYGEPIAGNGGLFGGRPVLPYQPEVEPESYHPDPQDEFYRCLANAEENSLSYSVFWEDLELENETDQETVKIPQVEMADTVLAERMNSRIREMLVAEDVPGEYLPQAAFYVTYMSEEALSVVLELGIPDPDTQQEYNGTIYMEYPDFLRVVNLDPATGEEIQAEDILTVTPGMANRFWSLCAWQNPNEEILETFSEMELQGLVDKLSGEDRILFYTPVGVELGFNYEGGWITATVNREHSLPYYRFFLEDPDYEPSSKDAYYKRLVNAVREDLSYQVEFQVHNYEDETGRYYFYYPQLKGGQIPNLEEINARIREVAFVYSEEAYIGAPEGVETVSYVTYMDEEVLSVVVCEYTYYLNLEGIWENGGRLYCVTFDLQEGKEIPKTEILDMDVEFASRFLELLEEQEEKNPQKSNMELETPESIYRYYLTDEWNNLVFYTPVGIEAGFNRIGYYLTVTVKE